MAVSGQFYDSSDGDVLDAIVVAHYGNSAERKVESVLAANPNLAALGAVLPIGTRVFLPDLVSSTPVEAIQLWY